MLRQAVEVLDIVSPGGLPSDRGIFGIGLVLNPETVFFQRMDCAALASVSEEHVAPSPTKTIAVGGVLGTCLSNGP